MVTNPPCVRIETLKPKTILITEAEKHLSGLQEMIHQFQEAAFTLTTQYKPMYFLLQLAFGEMENVRIRFESIYTRCLHDDTFDYIYSLPDFGHKVDHLSSTFLTRDCDGIAIENMLEHLHASGTLDMIVPAKITFSTMGYEKLRTYITDQFHVENIYILPEGTFKPVTAIKTYLLSISTDPKPEVSIGMLKLDRPIYEMTNKKSISTQTFITQEDWRIELLLAEDDEHV